MRRVSIIIAVLVFLLLARHAFAYDNHDFQVWNIDVEEWKLNDKVKAVFEQEFRWGNNASQFYYQHYDFGLLYRLKKYLDVGGGYRQIYELKNGIFRAENEPYLAAVLMWELKGFKFDDRNRLEYKDYDYQADYWRYRNKLTIQMPWSFTKANIRPFLSDEIFIALGGNKQLNENRLSAGFGIDILPKSKLRGEIFYMLRSMKTSSGWIENNILGTRFKLSF